MSKVNKKFSELSELDEKGLHEAYETVCKETFELSLKLNAGQLNETHLAKLNRKKIARIKTLISQKRGVN